MRLAIAALLVSCVAQVNGADIGDANFAGYPVEITFNAPTNSGVFARAFGDTAWKPLTLAGNQTTFTVHGQNTGLRFQVWNANDAYYTQFERLVGILAADTFNNTLHLTELQVDLPNSRKQYHTLLTGPFVPANFIDKPAWHPIVNLPASVPEPSAGILACLAIPFLRIARRYA